MMVYELKLVNLSKNKSLPFNRIAEHQIDNLLKARKRLHYKIPDVGVSLKPFDAILLKNCQAYIAVCFYVVRKRKTVYFINILDFVPLRCLSFKKSIREDTCQREAEFIINL